MCPKAYGTLLVLTPAIGGLYGRRLELCVDYNLTFAFLGNHTLIYRHLISALGEKK